MEAMIGVAAYDYIPIPIPRMLDLLLHKPAIGRGPRTRLPPVRGPEVLESPTLMEYWNHTAMQLLLQ